MKYKLSIMTALVAVLFFVPPAFAGNQTTSGATGATTITKARYYLNEATASFWSDAELLQWLNDGQIDIVARTHCLEGTETETIVTGTNQYAISTSYITVKGVIYNSVQSLRKGSIEHMGDTTDVGEPAYYFTWDNNLMVYPSPDSGVSGYSLVTYLVEKPTPLASTASTVAIPSRP